MGDDFVRVIKGYYDGVKIVMEENVPLVRGQRVTIHVPDEKTVREKKTVDFSRYVGKGGRMLHMDAQEYVNGLRENDRV